MFTAIKKMPILEDKIHEQWENNPQELFTYENLEKSCGLASLDETTAYYVVSNPIKKTRFTEYSGEVMYISIHRDDFKKAFNLIAPIISKTCFSFNAAI